MKIGFRLKLILSYAAVILISFGAVAFFLDRKLEERSLHATESSLISQARLAVQQVPPERVAKEETAYLERLARSMAREAQCRITVIDTRGKVLADSEESAEEVSRMDNHIGRPEVRAALAGAVGINTRFSPTLKINMLYAALPIKDRDAVVGILRFSLPLESVEKTLWSIRRIIFIGFLFAMALAAALGTLLASQTIRPINRMIHVSRKFSDGDFGRRIIQAPRDEIGELAGTLNRMAQDIEDKIKEVRTQNQRLEAIFNSMVEGVLVVDRSGRIISANPAIGKIFGVAREDVEGRLFLEAIRNNDIAGIITEALKKGEGLSGEVSLVYPVRRIFQINATPVFDGPSVSGCLIVIHDITEIRRLETVRSDFVANVSHELKTPLTSIKGFVETLREGAIDDKEHSREFLGIIQDHADRLDKLVDDLLALSHLESKGMVLERRPFDFKKQVADIVAGFRSQLKNKGIEARNEVPDGFMLNADRDRIDQVMTNLIDNAIKFNKENGFIRILCEDAEGAVRVTVEDSGAGVPAKDTSRIFERFYRVDRARSRSLGGTGLGLSIVKHIVELHAGAVGVESAEGFGSKFWFTLPR